MPFREILNNLTPESWFFIIITSIIALLLVYFKKSQKAPAILTTISILGTFVGIALGLLHFDANDVQKSVPELIGGIKTAFWASIWGIFLAILFKLGSVFSKPKKHRSIGATADDIHNILCQIKNALNKDDGDLNTTLLKVQKSLSDDNDDSSLMSQFKKLRLDFTDLKADFRNFLNTAAENNSKALIDALKDVMRDFNAKINEQFGDNFKQLNQAVEKILIWQEEYRNQVSEMIEQNNQASHNLSSASKDFALIVEKTSSFTQNAKDCGLLIDRLSEQNKTIEHAFENLASYIETAKNGLPDIQDNLTLTIKQMKNATSETGEQLKEHLLKIIKDSQNDIQSQLEQSSNNNNKLHIELKDMLINNLQNANTEFNRNINKITEDTKEQSIIFKKNLEIGVEKIQETTNLASNKLVEQLNSIVQNIGQDIQNQLKQSGANHKSLQEELRTILLESLKTSNTEINNQIKQLIEQTRQQIKTLDTALTEELTKSLESFGKQMASLSTKFVNDYTPLTDRLREIIQIANRIER